MSMLGDWCFTPRTGRDPARRFAGVSVWNYTKGFRLQRNERFGAVERSLKETTIGVLNRPKECRFVKTAE